MNIKLSFLFCLLTMMLSVACHQPGQVQRLSTPTTPEEEVFYLIFPRSWYDSNGDRQGDLKGVTQHLDYLDSLGVTSIIMTPFYPSQFYHNYFADDFEGIDPEYGTLQDYLDMVEAMHARHMKFYMDMEVQYVTRRHTWYKDSYENPASPYSHYVFYNDSLNKEPSGTIYNLQQLYSYTGDAEYINTVNLYNPEVRTYMIHLFRYWVDPNGDGIFDDGVDGFRLDHMMDDMDNRGLMTNLFEGFWKPLIDSVKALNPAVKFIAEQADWSDPGIDYFEKAGIDIVYAFGPMFTMTKRNDYQAQIRNMLTKTPEGKYSFLFLDNHDLDRVATTVKSDPRLLRAKAAMLYLSKGIPFIYYGQELGMKGKSFTNPPTSVGGGITDGNDIPRREAFEWSADRDANGMALWYKDTGPWWDSTRLASHDGISVQEQERDPSSLLSFYKKLIHLRRSSPAFTTGDEVILPLDNPDGYAYARWRKDEAYLLFFNFGETSISLPLSVSSLPEELGRGNWTKVLGDDASQGETESNGLRVNLSPQGFVVLKRN